MKLTHDITAVFGADALTLSEEGAAPVIIAYREHPEIFGHPRFLMADLDKSVALVGKALKELIRAQFTLIAPKIIVSIERPLDGGVADLDKKLLEQIFVKAGARTVVFRDA